MVETKKSIRALAAKYRGVLVLDGDEGDQTSIKQVESDEARDDQTLDDHIGFGLSDEDLTFDYESMLDEEERDDDAIDLALKYTSSRLLALEKAANQVIFPHGVWVQMNKINLVTLLLFDHVISKICQSSSERFLQRRITKKWDSIFQNFVSYT